MSINWSLFEFIRGSPREIVEYVISRGRFEKTNPINRASTGNPRHEIRNPKRVERVKLKKQTQC
jgi:hypothetical protein